MSALARGIGPLISIVVAVIVTVIVGGLPVGVDRSHQDATDAAAVETPLVLATNLAQAAAHPHQDPDAAYRYFLDQRGLEAGSEIDLGRRYAAAVRQMAKMPVHVASSGRWRSAAMAKTGELGRWQSLGPGNIGGRTRALLIDPRRPRTMYAAGVSGGIWKTTDGGASWRALADLLPNIAVSTLALDPTNPEVIYAGTGEGFFREVVRGTALPLRGAGILVSRNAGQTWRRLPATAHADFHWVNDLVISSSDSRRLYAATRSGVWRSLDSGDSWTRILASTVNGGCLDLALRSDRSEDVLFAACGTFERATVHRRIGAEADGRWQAVLSEEGMGRTSLALAPSNQDIVYALSASYVGGPGGLYNGGLHAVFRSTTGGAPGSFQPQVRNSDGNQLNTLLLSNPIGQTVVACGLGSSNFNSTLGWYANVIAVDPTDPQVLWAGGVDLFRSDNGGQDWGPVSYWFESPPSAHADQHALVFDPRYDGTSNRRLFVAGDGGVYRSDNPRASKGSGTRATCSRRESDVRWTSLARGYGVTQFYHGTPYPDGSRFFGGTQDNGTVRGSLAAGFDGWNPLFGGDGGYTAIDPTNTDILYLETQRLNLQKSVDGGATFSSAINGITETSGNFLFIVPFVLDPNDPRRLWIGGRSLWRSADRANSWNRASATLRGQVSAIAVALGNSDRVLAGTSDGWIHRHEAATSSVAASTWQATRPRSGYVTWLAFDPLDERVAYATYAEFGGRHVWRTTDSGITWSALDGQGTGRLPDIPVHSLVVDPGNRQRLFIGTDLGVFASTDGGASWAVENTGFANTVTESLAWVERAGGRPLLYAFTHGRGAWRVEVAPSMGGGGGGNDDSCPWPLGHGHFCRDCGPCANGQGDCDRLSECQTGLECVNDIGAQFGFAPGIDVCRPAAGGACPWPPGHGHFCRDCGPCASGQGDCDNDSQCQPGLACVDNIGAEFGFSVAIDVCR